MTPLFVTLKCGYYVGDGVFDEYEHHTIVNISQIRYIESGKKSYKVHVMFEDRPLEISPEYGESLLQFLNYHQYLWGTP
jgi:hypothetical protein